MLSAVSFRSNNRVGTTVGMARIESKVIPDLDFAIIPDRKENDRLKLKAANSKVPPNNHPFFIGFPPTNNSEKKART